ncbi:MAG TPA: PIN domain-containing protein [Kofleriaceae bacterium]|nr:PIN domain-containing protein [Kofleriaceae bacterium]
MVTICDTGPLVAFLDRREKHHEWAVEMMRQVKSGPLWTCEAVLAEAFYFLREFELDVEPLFQMLERGAIRVDFSLDDSWPRVRTLMGRYRQMDLADASIVVMTERRKRCQVLTLDRRDFTVYRRNDRQVIPFIAPPK